MREGMLICNAEGKMIKLYEKEESRGKKKRN